MPVAAAGDNGGRYNMVHRQTDDGLVISVAMGDSLVPLVFRFNDYLNKCQECLLSSDFYPHACLMRGDCGWKKEEDDSVDLLFSWDQEEDKLIGLSSGPSGEYEEITETVENVAEGVRLAGLQGHRTVYYRKDREYWTPDKTLQADTPEELWGWSQWNPNSCPAKQPDKCGLVTFPKEECNQDKLKYVNNRNKVQEDKCKAGHR